MAGSTAKGATHPNHHAFRVLGEFRVYRLVGTYPSNSYYGSSQIHMPRYEARNATRGDEIRVLPGGTFHLTKADGLWWAISLDAPKGAFEKTYGLGHTDDERLDRKAAHDGRARRIPTPAQPVDHLGARERQTTFATVMPAVAEIDRSPEFVAFERLLGRADRMRFATKVRRTIERTDAALAIRIADRDGFGSSGIAWSLARLPTRPATETETTLVRFAFAAPWEKVDLSAAPHVQEAVAPEARGLTHVEYGRLRATKADAPDVMRAYVEAALATTRPGTP